MSRTLHRRTFLQQSSLLALTPMVPGFLTRTARSSRNEPGKRTLVVVQLDGGNDGINTVVPFRDEGYKQHRSTLALDPNRLVKVDDEVGLHPAMDGMGKLLERNELCIVHGVSYPNPNRSHFRSMAIWHTGHQDPDVHSGPGWLGRALDQAPRGRGMDSLHVGASQPVQALAGRRSVASSLDRLEDFALDPATKRGRGLSGGESAGDLEEFVRRSTLDAYTTADQLAKLIDGGPSDDQFPSSRLGHRFKQVARLIQGDVGARVYYIVHPGFDTHAGQIGPHQSLLNELSDAMLAFSDSLHKTGHAEECLVLCFSEFGRRIAENGGQGTDHGTAGPVFLAGPAVRAGGVGKVPSMTDGIDGDLRMSADFRSVYGTVITEWLGLDAKAALAGDYPTLPLFDNAG